jgi:hypothetical protein
VLSGPKRRRRWSTEQKQLNFVEVFAPGAFQVDRDSAELRLMHEAFWCGLSEWPDRT